MCLEAGLLCVLAFATWSHGAVEPAPRAAAVAVLGALATLALARHAHLRGRHPILLGPSGLGVCALIFLCLMGTLRAFYAHEAVARLSVWLAAGAVYLITVILVERRGPRRRLKLGLVGLGAGAAMEVLMGPPGPGGGPFVNPDHLAALLAATLPLAVASAALASHEERHSGAVFAYAGATIVCLLGLFATQSRGGILAGLAGVFFVIAAVALGQVQGKVRRWSAATVFLLAICTAAWMEPSLARRGFTRFRASDPGSESSAGMRFSIWRSALRAAVDGGPLGWGLGSFPWVYPAYRGVDIPYSVPHAHNDWLEGTVELGWLFPAAGLAAGMAIFARAVGTRRLQHSRLLAACALGGAGGLAAIALHALVDFPFQIPSLAWTAAALAGLSGAKPGPDEEAPGAFTDELRSSAHAAGDWGIRVTRTSLVALACGIATIGLAAAGAREAMARARIASAEIALDHLDLDKARAQARRAVAIDPGSAKAQEALGRTLVELSRFGGGGRHALEAARKSFIRAATRNPRDAEAWLEAAHMSEALGDARSADAAYRRAVSLDPRSAPVREAQATFLLRSGSKKEALAALRAAAESDVRALSRVLDQLWVVTGDADALAAVTPSDSRSQIRLGDYLDNHGLPARARAAWSSAERLAPRDAAPAVRIARLSLRSGEAAQAVEETRAALARGAGGPDLQKTYASALASAGRLEEAARVYRALFASDPTGADAGRALAEIEQRLGRREEAARLRAEIVRVTPGDLSARLELARAYQAAGRWSSALETCRAVLAIDPSHAGCRLLLVDLYLERGLFTAAEAVLEEWLSVRPSDIAALTRMAKFYESLDRWPEARAEYEQLLSLDPKNADARAALARDASAGGHP